MMTVPNFVTISQTVGEIGDLSIFQNGGRPPSWICFARVWTIHEEHLKVLSVMQNLVELAVYSFEDMCEFQYQSINQSINLYLYQTTKTHSS